MSKEPDTRDFSVTVPGRVRSEGRYGLAQDVSVADALHASETRDGVRRRKPEGWIPPTPYSFLRERYDRLQGHYRKEEIQGGQVTNWHDIEGVVGQTPGGDHNSLNIFDEMLVVSSPSQAMQDKALIKARLKMKSGDINLGVAFAERSRTAQLIADTGGRLVRSYRDLRRGRWRESASWLGYKPSRKPRGTSVTQQWLEYQYGWRPLLGDCFGAVDALTRQPRDNWIVTGKAFEKEPFDKDWERGSPGQLNGQFKGQVRGYKGVMVRIDAVPQNDVLMSLASLGITNPALIAWELVPFSFVADWLLPVGAYVDSLDAMLGYGDTWCSISSIYRARWDYTMLSGSVREGDTTYRNTASLQPARKESVGLTRSVYTSVPLPTMPRLGDPRSLTRMANALSLVAQIFSGRR